MGRAHQKTAAARVTFLILFSFRYRARRLDTALIFIAGLTDWLLFRFCSSSLLDHSNSPSGACMNASAGSRLLVSGDGVIWTWLFPSLPIFSSSSSIQFNSNTCMYFITFFLGTLGLFYLFSLSVGHVEVCLEWWDAKYATRCQLYPLQDRFDLAMWLCARGEARDMVFRIGKVKVVCLLGWLVRSWVSDIDCTYGF